MTRRYESGIGLGLYGAVIRSSFMMSVIPLPNLTTGVPADTTIARDLPGNSGADGTEHATQVPRDRGALRATGAFALVDDPMTASIPETRNQHGCNLRNDPAGAGLPSF